jgi:hypothetical protein
VSQHVTDGDLDELKQILAAYGNVEVPSGFQELKRDAGRQPTPRFVEHLRRGLAHVLEHRSLTPRQLEDLTDRAFDSQDEVQAWLQEMWDTVFGEER